MKSALLIKTPLGTMTLVESNGALAALRFEELVEPGERLQSTTLLRRAAAELEEYFKGRRKDFNIPLAPGGTAFQQAVWKALLKIPYGETRSYGDIAKQIGSPKASRAVGQANNKNPLPIFIPCHRVIGADGSMVGFGGKVPLKEALLALEAKAAR